MHDWPPEAHSEVASVKIVQRTSPAGGGPVAVADVKLRDKIRALELAATYLGLLKKKVEHTGEIDLVTRLRAARLWPSGVSYGQFPPSSTSNPMADGPGEGACRSRFGAGLLAFGPSLLAQGSS